MSLLGEIKRRKVFQVAAVYAVVAWLIMQIVDVVGEPLNLPAWFDTVTIVLLAIGFPIAVILGWAFDLTPQGIKPDSAVRDDHIPAQAAGQRLNYVLHGLVLLAVAFLVLDQYVLEGTERLDEVEQPRERGGAELVYSQHFDLTLPADTPLALIGAATLGNGRQAFAISPDGTKVVYVGDRNGVYELFLRELDGHDSRVLPGTRNGYSPFFSPNSSWVGFFANNELKRVHVDGDDSLVVAEATNATGAVWRDDDEILVATDEGAFLARVPVQGGDREVIREGAWSLFPHSIPGRPDVLVSNHDGQVSVFNTESGESMILPIKGREARVANDFLFFIVGNSLYAARFDPTTFSLSSAPVPALIGLRVEVYGTGQWSLADNGTMLYVSGTSAGSNPLHWVHGENAEVANLPIRERGSFEISPDGQRLIVLEHAAGASDVWLYDFEQAQPRKLTIDGQASSPIFWMPDGESIVYNKRRGDRTVPYHQHLNAAIGEPLLPAQYTNVFASSISEDGRYLGVFDDRIAKIAVIDLDTATETEIPTVGDVNWGTAVSPDGRAVVYTTAESGEYHNYLQSFPPTGERYPISREGGAEEPRWSRDGSAIYYRSGQRIMAVPVAQPEVELGEPYVFFEGEFENVLNRSYDVHPDVQRALVIKGANTATSIHVVTNWFAEVERIIRENEASSQ